MHGNKKIAILWAIAALWTIFLFYLAAQSGDSSGAMSGRIMQIVLRIFPALDAHTDIAHTVLRKLAHMGVFTVEGILIAAAARRTWRRAAAWISAPICALLAAANELTQLLAAGRSCEIRDMLIDFGGAVLGICIVWLAERRKVG